MKHVFLESVESEGRTHMTPFTKNNTNFQLQSLNSRTADRRMRLGTTLQL